MLLFFLNLDIERAIAFIKEGNYTRAIEILEKEKSSETIYYLGWLYLKERQYDRILEFSFPDSFAYFKFMAAKALNDTAEMLSYAKRCAKSDTRCCDFLIDYYTNEPDSFIEYVRMYRDGDKKRRYLILYYKNRDTAIAKRYVKRLSSRKQRIYYSILLCNDNLLKQSYIAELIRGYPDSREARLFVEAFKPLDATDSFYLARIKKDKGLLKILMKNQTLRKKAVYELARIYYKEREYEIALQYANMYRSRVFYGLKYRILRRLKDSLRFQFLDSIIKYYPEKKYIVYKGIAYERDKEFLKAAELYLTYGQRLNNANLMKRAGIIYAYLGNVEKAKKIFKRYRHSSSLSNFYLFYLTGDSTYLIYLKEKEPLSYYTVFLAKIKAFDNETCKEWIVKWWDGDSLFEVDSAYIMYNLALRRPAVIEKYLKRTKQNPFVKLMLIEYFLRFGYPNYAIKWAERLLSQARRHRYYRVSYELVSFLFPLYYKDLIDKDIRVEFLSLVRQESWFNDRAKSSANAIGLSQLLYSTAKSITDTITKEDLFFYRINLKIGMRHFKTLKQAYNNTIFAYAAYNAGGGNLKTWRRYLPRDSIFFIDLIPFSETRGYLRNCLKGRVIYNYLLEGD